MTLTESLLVGMFCVTVVFIVLVALFLIIRTFSVVFGNLKPSSNVQGAIERVESTDSQALPQPVEEEVFSSGTLKLRGVDEKTAAMIMAIVSDESEIPLSELCFKSIRLIGEN